MKKIVLFLAVALMSIVMCSCSENYSEGEKVGVLTEFAKSGLLWDSWDGNLNITQTGMNTSGDPFTFSFDNDRDDQSQLIDLMKEAQVKGWKIKIKYHRVRGWNWFHNRGRYNISSMTLRCWIVPLPLLYCVICLMPLMPVLPDTSSTPFT